MTAVLVELETRLTGGEEAQFCGPCLGSCFVPMLEPEVRLLVSFHPGHIIVSSTAEKKTERVASFRTLNRIVAFNTVLPAGLQTHWLVVLTEINELFVLSLCRSNEKTLDLVVVQQFKLTNSLLRKKATVDATARKKVVVSQKCFIRIDETGRFIVVHSCRRFVVVLELKPSKKELFRLAAANKTPPLMRKNPELAAISKYKVFGSPEVYAIDDDMVIDLEVLHSRDANDDPVWSLAFLLRNKRLDYELTFYRLPTRQGGGLELQARFPAGDTYPNLIIPMKKFMILIYDTYHVICGSPGINMVKDFQRADEASAVELDGDGSCLKQDLSVDSGRNSFFKSYALLDDITIILVTASFQYYTIELDYDYVPYNTSSLRTRSRVTTEDDGMQNTLIWRKWDIKEAHGFNGPDGFQPDQIFFSPQSNSFLEISKNGQIASFSPGYINPPDSEPILNLPITDLKIDSHSGLSFTSGDLQRARFKSPDFEFSSANELMKDHILMDSFTIILTEAIVRDVSSSSSHDTIERLNVYHPDGSCIASYEMEENVSVTCMVPLRNVVTFKSDDNDFHRNDILDVERSLEKSFLVLTTSANDYDYESDDDFFQRKRTEILLMIINEESNELELKTISVLRAKVDCAEQTSKMAFTLWGVGCCFSLGLQVYKDEGEGTKSSLQVKMIKIGEKLDLPINTVSMVRDLKEGLKLLVDPFCGVYLAKLGVDDKVLSMHHIFEWSMISAVDVYSENMFVAGDLLGNIFLLNMDYTGKEIPSCELFTSFNSTHGAIGCISCYPQNMEQNKDSLLKVCCAGTSDGAIFSIHVCGDSRNGKFLKALKAQNTSVLRKSGLYFEQVARNLPVPKIDLRAVDPAEVYLECEALMEDRFIKVSLASDNEIDEAGRVPVVFI